MQVFRTFNASYTLDQELAKLDDHPDKKALCRFMPRSVSVLGLRQRVCARAKCQV